MRDPDVGRKGVPGLWPGAARVLRQQGRARPCGRQPPGCLPLSTPKDGGKSAMSPEPTLIAISERRITKVRQPNQYLLDSHAT
jgi:hypothetical protein